MPAADGVRTLSHLLFRPATQVAVLYVDWAQWRTGRPGLGRPLLADLRHEAPAGDGRSAGPQHRFIGQLRGAGPQERGRLVESYLREQVAGKLGLAPSRLDVESPLNDLGVDSLIAVELRSQIERDTGIVVPVVQLLDGPSVAVLAGRLGERLADAGQADTEPAAAAGPETTDADRSRWADLLDQLPDVPDDDVDELLRELLAAREGQDEG